MIEALAVEEFTKLLRMKPQGSSVSSGGSAIGEKKEMK
ncbi:hypothetical protein HBHAL_4883 [Halobacillus halophilus DSM 2266]|uniref:Uncharacterized protein n=1 Tax=Halobacillus halophilus (strain ATCC 35676 / DSM 2266 / JCM 20832 / KCTC 3685 / LMG 17431 / NBRC 102448 / NCIMB 2269) TaxID=866895 RepID=I0JSU8_HALH3|nr:hypothetical protein HBHAL_4883 [Halobacillus halophilus DSM 2266]